jgi:hypothetical protein
VKVGQTNALGSEPVDVRCLGDWISMTGKFTITLIVGHHDDDIRTGGECV